MTDASDRDADSNSNHEHAPNPYQPPHTASTIRREPITRSWLFWTIGLQVLTILGVLIAEHIVHTLIVVGGAVLFLIGGVVAVLALQRRHVPGIVVGSSAMAVCAFVVFLINYYGWNPATGDRPITLIGYAYTALVVPLALYVMWTDRSDNERIE